MNININGGMFGHEMGFEVTVNEQGKIVWVGVGNFRFGGNYDVDTPEKLATFLEKVRSEYPDDYKKLMEHVTL
ncbi:hypothetical protein NVP1216O_31 [Vibrio phage 1.216.O._10N.222.55.C12]|nr:hypothetical protein NVP1216O_31 [Vibrio phage 1.216.O._10N.222.55.C12]